MHKQKQKKKLKKEIEILKQQLEDKQALLNGLLDMLYKDSEESDEGE